MAAANKTGLVTRVVSLPVRTVSDRQDFVMTGEAQVLNLFDAFRPAWQLATDLANWAQFQLVCRDAVRTPGMDRLPRYDRVAMFGTVPRRFARKAVGDKPAQKPGDPQVSSLYDLWTREYPARAAWDGAAANARDVLKAVEETWTHHKSFGRYAVLWKGQARPMVFRFPYPWPVPADKGRTVRLTRDGQNRPVVSIPFVSPHDRIHLRLADGREFRRELRRFDVLREHPERLGQAKICGRLRGGRLVGADLKIVGQFEAAEPQEGGVSATATTGPDRLLTVFVDGRDEPFPLNWDHLRGLIACHDRWAQRLREDLKHEKRWPSWKRQRIVNGDGVRARFDKANGRIASEIKQVVACLVGFLKRQRVSTLTYTDTDKSFVSRFPWSTLRERVRCKCQEEGIEMQVLAEANDVE